MGFKRGERMKEAITNFLTDISDLSEEKQIKRVEDFFIMQIENFILWNWSNDKDRDKEIKQLNVWVKEVEE